jgi:L,D-transpeptidase YcbB
MRPTRRLSLFVCVGTFAAAVACGPGAVSTPELQSLLASESPPKGVTAVVWADARAFYAARETRLAWITPHGPGEKTAAALDALSAAASHGLDPRSYHEPALRALSVALAEATDRDDRQQQIAELDVRLTTALLHAGRHVATGRLDPARVDPRWNTRREAPDYVTALARAADASTLTFLESVQPVHPEYQALRDSLASFGGQVAGGWPTVPRGSVKAGDANAAVVLPLRQRLAMSGYLDASASLDSPQFDEEVGLAIGRFQEHHGLRATGILDRTTLERMNVPLETRIAQVAMNLERWRWLPDDLGGRHFMVNVPRFRLLAREHGARVLDMRVVVGKRGNETPLFADEMETVVFSPYWNIPETIALEETAPAVARDPDYLARNNMEILDASGTVVPADTISWDDEAALEGYRFRQRPGADNALGHVKFLFPNKHAVYLHDTPADALFERIGRAFSHGCVRVEEPERLAEYVLRDQKAWTSDAIRASMRAGTERHVKVTQPIPIFIVYMTAWVDENGGLHFEDDVYGYDARQARR